MRKRHYFVKLLKIVVAISLFGAGALLLWLSTLQIPDFKGLEQRKVSESTKIYDRTGKTLLYDIHKGVTRKIVPYGDISPYLRNATIAIEDSDFYQHNGVKFGSMIRSAIVNIESGSLRQGGSTITQQVIKNALLTSEKRFSRKIKEVILAFKLERIMTKEDILALYLNEIPYGGSVYGAEDASQKFYGKDVKSVTLAEAAYMAAIPNAPSLYSPYGKNKTSLDARKNSILDKMVGLKFITKEESDLAKKEIVVFLPREDTGGIKAPHFVEYVRAYLEEKYGQESVETSGFRVITTLDWDLEQKAEQIVKKYAEQNETKFNAKNAGMVAIDPKTGQVLVMVGSRDYFNVANEGNFNVTTAHRQPGSSFKPFVYATAFNKGYLPETTLLDLDTQFQTTCSPEGVPLNESVKKEACYSPVNYDGNFIGPISLRNALAQSRNVPAIKLLYLVGINDSIQTARNMGVRGLDDPMRYGLTLVLGGGEVSLLDITSAYSVFANDGTRNPHQVILRIEDKDGNIIDAPKNQTTRVLPINTARTINSILSDIKAREPLFGEYSSIDIPGKDVAVKTGTTNDFRDAWVVGYTPNITVGVWAGNNDNSPMVKKTSGYIALPMWSEFLKYAVATSTPTNERFLKPDTIDTSKINPVLRGLWQGGISYDVDKISGKLATNNTPKEMRDTRVVKQTHSILYWIDKKNPTGPAPTNPDDDPQFILWESAVQKWAKANNMVDETLDVIPKDTDNIHKPEFAPKVIITNPTTNTAYNPKSRMAIKIQNSSTYPLSQVDFFINNTYLGSSKSAPFDFYFIPAETPNLTNNNTIRVVVYDSVLNKTEAETTFMLSI
ncbi:MAG: PBP1A family penicillin-binding protein [bacterium]|nr:PBP1A family penicillin-binding protein [bacterium]